MPCGRQAFTCWSGPWRTGPGAACTGGRLELEAASVHEAGRDRAWWHKNGYCWSLTVPSPAPPSLRVHRRCAASMHSFPGHQVLHGRWTSGEQTARLAASRGSELGRNVQVCDVAPGLSGVTRCAPRRRLQPRAGVAWCPRPGPSQMGWGGTCPSRQQELSAPGGQGLGLPVPWGQGWPGVGAGALVESTEPNRCVRVCGVNASPATRLGEQIL